VKIYLQDAKEPPGYLLMFRGFCPLAALVKNLSLGKIAEDE